MLVILDDVIVSENWLDKFVDWSDRSAKAGRSESFKGKTHCLD
jgi:hypothetical protein